MKPFFVASMVSVAVACSSSLVAMHRAAGDDPSPPADKGASAAPIVAPTMSDAQPKHFSGLHNVVAYYKNFWSGSVPEGDEGFRELARLGVKTIISVDGAEPDLALREAHGMRYIHLPIGYNGFDEERTLELARASRDALANGPVYVHCHHGKHRSAGAAGAVAVTLGWSTPAEMVERMKVSGTAPDYKGLYACTTNATPRDAKTIDAVPANFPEIAKPQGFVKAMVETDEIVEHLKLIEKAGWVAPKDHPDLVPVAEAGRLADVLRFSAESDRAKRDSAAFRAHLVSNSDLAQALEDLIANGEKDVAKLSAQFKRVNASCKECHVAHRDVVDAKAK